MIEAAILIPEDHPALDGHFPGNPIVPGVVLLAEVMALAAEHDIAAATILQAKFPAPLRPGQLCRIAITGDGPWRVTCRVGETTILTGILAP